IQRQRESRARCCSMLNSSESRHGPLWNGRCAMRRRDVMLESHTPRTPRHLLPAGSVQRDIALAMVDQAILSAFNFALQIALIKLWSPDQFGVFALLVNSLLILSNFQNGLFTTQYSILV